MLAACYTAAAYKHPLDRPRRPGLACDMSSRFGCDAYRAEEFVAELGAAAGSAQFGLEQATRRD